MSASRLERILLGIAFASITTACRANACTGTLQSSAMELDSLVSQRIVATERGDTSEVRRLDQQILAIDAERQSCISDHASGLNPKIRPYEPDSGLYVVEFRDGENVRTVYGNLYSLQDFTSLEERVYAIGHLISHTDHVHIGPSAELHPRLLVAGSSIQGRVITYPADIDYVEEFTVRAPSIRVAALILANAIQREVIGASTSSAIEFVKMIIGFTDHRVMLWTENELLQGVKEENGVRHYLADILRRSDLAWINTFWQGYSRGDMPGDFTKVIVIRVQFPGDSEPRIITDMPPAEVIEADPNSFPFLIRSPNTACGYQYNAVYILGDPPG